ncbi:LOW QUALITY PROTEIN: probable 18S rRNA (guanine-N(7))-methyltransferase [Phymastichus coffea]|uniref:LOW QUALITY PROTEIN: probable 18S rRNA (guanine-N(7))-methyltransferase n=1 Tax=Phymastichus coffea TaxID=108790 RepID=UPI00273C7C8F|nr:LOW QUALITY PROTEIN: probable 18S rRNA (guanine-N(7))-methyltransferase [Phymastichus coffea]
MKIQIQMSERAVELLSLPKNNKCLLLDIGCGTGMSGSVLNKEGHHWIGLDISPAMLNVAMKCNRKGDLILSDIGQGISFCAGCFDGAISISVLQWLCNSDKKLHIVKKRLQVFFRTLFSSLSTHARAIFQFYPENNEQVNVIIAEATKSGFFGGTVIDFPNSTKAKKIFLVLMTSNCIYSSNPLMKTRYPDQENNPIRKLQSRNKRSLKCHKNWILKKKQKFRRQGKFVKNDSKYSSRRRCLKF